MVGRSTLMPSGAVRDCSTACWKASAAWISAFDGNAADIEAGAAQPAFAAALLDQHGVEAELAGADRRDVAAGAAAHDQDLGIDVGHLTPL